MVTGELSGALLFTCVLPFQPARRPAAEQFFDHVHMIHPASFFVSPCERAASEHLYAVRSVMQVEVKIGENSARTMLRGL